MTDSICQPSMTQRSVQDHLGEKAGDDAESCGVVLGAQVQAGQASLYALTQECALLPVGPLNLLSADLHLHAMQAMVSWNSCCMLSRGWAKGAEQILGCVRAL